MTSTAFIFTAMLLYAASASATVTIENRVLQKGYFVQGECRSASSKENKTDEEEGWDECACEADVGYPQITGLDDIGAQAELNMTFRHAAEQAQCKGTQSQKPASAPGDKPQPSPSSISHHYEVTFQSPHMLGLEFTDWEYLGGAHGNGALSGMIIDLDKAHVLSIGDVIAAKDLAGVNQAIYATLSAMPEEEVFRDQIENRKGAFIKEGQCAGCTLTLTPVGVNVVFQTYEVAPYSSGNVSVPIPIKFIGYPAIAAALAQQAHSVASPEKQ